MSIPLMTLILVGILVLAYAGRRRLPVISRMVGRLMRLAGRTPGRGQPSLPGPGHDADLADKSAPNLPVVPQPADAHYTFERQGLRLGLAISPADPVAGLLRRRLGGRTARRALGAWFSIGAAVGLVLLLVLPFVLVGLTSLQVAGSVHLVRGTWGGSQPVGGSEPAMSMAAATSRQHGRSMHRRAVADLSPPAPPPATASAVPAPGSGVMMLIPGYNVPLPSMLILALVLLLSVVVHELGHALAAVASAMTVQRIHFQLTPFPGGCVIIDETEYERGTFWQRIMVSTAGVWHNLVACLALAIVLPLLVTAVGVAAPAGQSGLAIWRTGAGVAVADVSSTSPLRPYLPLGARIRRLDGCPVLDHESWVSCIDYLNAGAPPMASAQVGPDSPIPQRFDGYCVSHKTIVEYATRPEYDCCDRSATRPGANGFCLVDRSPARPGEDPLRPRTSICLPVYGGISEATPCGPASACQPGHMCLSPDTAPGTRLVQVKLDYGSADGPTMAESSGVPLPPIFFYGSPLSLWREITVSGYIPRWPRPDAPDIFLWQPGPAGQASGSPPPAAPLSAGRPIRALARWGLGLARRALLWALLLMPVAARYFVMYTLSVNVALAFFNSPACYHFDGLRTAESLIEWVVIARSRAADLPPDAGRLSSEDPERAEPGGIAPRRPDASLAVGPAARRHARILRQWVVLGNTGLLLAFLLSLVVHTSLTVALVGPPPPVLLILLHALGQDELSAQRLAERLELEHCAALSLRAPSSTGSQELDLSFPFWWDAPLDWRTNRPTRPAKSASHTFGMPGSLLRSLGDLIRALEHPECGSWPASAIVLVGFGHGGSVALSYALASHASDDPAAPPPVGGAVSVGGGLICPPKTPAAPSAGRTSVLLLSGQRDALLPEHRQSMMAFTGWAPSGLGRVPATTAPVSLMPNVHFTVAPPMGASSTVVTVDHVVVPNKGESPQLGSANEARLFHSFLARAVARATAAGAPDSATVRRTARERLEATAIRPGASPADGSLGSLPGIVPATLVGGRLGFVIDGEQYVIDSDDEADEPEAGPLRLVTPGWVAIITQRDPHGRLSIEYQPANGLELD